ncbi:MAG: circularly permuted type 2 ATP-grasp protein, partial [Marinobacter sp.]|nr:circularly permuted type 2 ATP-grasp protein [Marinobacter sp.]
MKKNKSIDWKNYDPNDFYDELIAAKGSPRPAATAITDYLGNLGSDEIQARQQAAELAILEMGISFTIYSEGENIDRAWPFDIIPR